MKAQKFLNKHQKWTKGCYARDNKGKLANAEDKGACRFDLNVALLHCYPKGSKTAYRKILKVISELYPDRSTSVTVFNDHTKTTFKDVKKVLRKANV